jgi:hypothetical protein
MSHMMSFVKQFKNNRDSFYHSESSDVQQNASWVMKKKLLFCETPECWSQNSLYRTNSVYTWLDNDWTLKRNVTDALLLRQFFWLRMLQNVCTFCRNCDKCCMNNSWKNCQQGFLKPLPVEENLTKIFIDFVVNLLSSKSCTNLLMITELSQQESDTEIMQRDDCRMSDSDIHTTFLLSSWAFITIVSDWETQFVSSLWKESVSYWRLYRECSQLITQKLMRWQNMNQNVELYICTFFNYSQDNWANLLLMTELIIIIMTQSLQSEPLLLISQISHEALAVIWKLRLIQSAKSSVQKSKSNCSKDEESHRVSTDDHDCCSTDAEKMINWKRQQLYNFKKEDKIWLNLKNIHTDWLCKKFDVKNVKYIIVKRLAHISFVWIHCQRFTMCFTQLCFVSSNRPFLFSVWQTHNPHHKL